jgi:hypothetical protein
MFSRDSHGASYTFISVELVAALHIYVSEFKFRKTCEIKFGAKDGTWSARRHRRSSDSLTHSTMTSKGSGSEPTIRRRLHVLERAQSLSALKKRGADLPKILPLEMKHKSRDDQPPSSATDYDSQSESSEEDQEHSANGTEDGVEDAQKTSTSTPPSRPKLHTRNLRRRSPQRDPMSPQSRAWYEFDLAVVVALVSPIGNWLTGGDHIKHLLLIALLIFYLHQIIESELLSPHTLLAS